MQYMHASVCVYMTACAVLVSDLSISKCMEKVTPKDNCMGVRFKTSNVKYYTNIIILISIAWYMHTFTALYKPKWGM